MITLKEIAKLVGGLLLGEGATPISGISDIKEAKDGEVAVLINRSYRKYLTGSEASAFILGEDTDSSEVRDRNLVLVKNPADAYLKIARHFFRPRETSKGIHPLAAVSDSASVAPGAAVGAYSCIEKGAVLETDVTIHPFVYIGADVTIGEGTTIHPHVTVYDGAVIGRRVTIHAGTVIGGDGFGYMWDGKSHVKIPQLGIVEIGDDVEIGANVTIDRASLGRTRIGKGVRIDNLVQIAHNVSIGDNSIVVAQVGIAGSAVIGRNVVLAGQAGVRDHATVGDNVKAGGQTGIVGDVRENALIMGTPHMDHREWAKLQGYLRRLPRLFETVKRIEKKLPPEAPNG